LGDAQVRYQACRPLVLGFGNVLLRDDGAGARLAAQLQVEMGFGLADFVDCGTMIRDLLPYIEARDSLLVIDSADLSGVPGTVRLFEGPQMDGFLKSTRCRTVRELGVTDLIAMARLRGCLPSRRALLCIQPGCVDRGKALSIPVAQAMPAAAMAARELLEQWGRA
jgi:hydrogenase maturation protease